MIRLRHLSVVCLLALGAVLRAEVPVYADGRALLPVYVAADAAPDERLAAEELARVLGVMSGLDWPVRVEPVGQGAGFFVGRTHAAARTLPALRPAKDLLAPAAGEIGPDGFRLRTRGGRVYIEAATPEATPFAVSWLLQRYGGARWYAPGALGEVIPWRAAWTLPDLAVVREPAYVSREITGLYDAAGRDWARRNGLRQRLEYSHNLTRVFPPELYDTHPEWFGLVDGARRRPLGGSDYHWQPDLARADVAEHAAARAAEAFARDAGRASFALGMNDTVRFDQGAGTRAAVEPLRYFRGMPDYSPLVFGFMNRAAEALGRTPGGAPNRYLGCLAYFWCENPPPFPVDARVVPYVTTDRTQFYDRAYRAADLELMTRWGRSGVRAYGLWEYAYGSAFVVPRVPHAALAEAVREGWWRGARGYIADTGPHAGFDAFKVWILAQLLWEPDRPVAELADDFFGGWYGPAAEPMRRFFARCEEVWMAQPGPPWWIKYYQQQDQVLLFPPAVCAELRGLLDEAREMADNGGQRTVDGGQWASCRSAESTAQERLRDGRKAEGRKDRGVECGNQESGNGERRAFCRSAFVPRQNLRDSPARCASERGGGARSAEDGRQMVDGGRWAPDAVSGSRSPDSSLLAPRYFERVSLTSRAFAVTEAAGTFDGLRRELAAPAAETLPAAELGARLVGWLRARAAFNRALAAATGGEAPALATRGADFLLRNDPVPGLLASLGRRDRVAPLAALAELTIAGEPVPAHWAALAVAYAKNRLAGAPERLANGWFGDAAPGGLQPDFLHPRSGDIPAGWEVRAAPTEQGRVALGSRILGRRILRVEGAWDTQVTQAQPVQPGELCVAEVQMRGRSSPGNDAALTLAFVDAAGKLVGEYRATMLPKGESTWRRMTLADTAPATARYVVVGLVATRQFDGDWLEAAEATLRVAE
ncbi:MAG TPA: DUF4838 domain-containing protein [Opitutaceae bacterium]|nr:DUF4838 domain-containing protein [Opitutaceae bacterium]